MLTLEPFTEQTGLDIHFDPLTNRLYFGPEVAHAGYGRRSVGDLAGLFRDMDDPDADCYTFYRGIGRFDELAGFSRYGLRYDITVIMPGTVNGEHKKTSGHYHGPMAGYRAIYPEVYEVLKGTAVYVLQKPTEPVTDETQEVPVSDFVFVEAHAGESVVIPGGYGHCSINTGDGPLVFANIAAVDCPLFYTPVQRMHGMAYYRMRDGAVANPHYKNAAPPRSIPAAELPGLGLSAEPVYSQFIREPERFLFLTDPYSSYSDAAAAIISLSSARS